MANKEVWGKSDQEYGAFPSETWFDRAYGRHGHRDHVAYDHDDVTHPALQGLWRATNNNHEVRFDHHLHGIRHNATVADNGEGGPADLWDHLETESNLPTKLLGHRISDRTRALIHDPHIAADSAEDEGHDGIAKMLRHGELVHTHYGYDKAYHPDTSFVHNGHVHMLVRDHTGQKRYHFVRPVGE